MKVKDTAGAVVGTVVKIDATTVTVRTGKHDITIPGQSFTLDQGVLLFGMTQAQLDASFEAAEAAAQAALQVGLPVKGAAGSVVGTIADINEEEVTLDVEGAKVVLPRRAIVGSPDGAVIGLTIEQLKAQLPELGQVDRGFSSRDCGGGASGLRASRRCGLFHRLAHLPGSVSRCSNSFSSCRQSLPSR